MKHKRLKYHVSSTEMKFLHFDWMLVFCIWLFGCLCVCSVAKPAPAPESAAHGAGQIPESAISELREELAQGAIESSSIEKRMACKDVIRQSLSLLSASPNAPNRFALLDILFQGQKILLTLEATPNNREAVFETATRLMDAPDEYMESRLEADLLLSERDLANANATVAERVKALKDIIAKYRGTSAERLSLTIAALIAAKLQAFDLQKEIYDELADSSFGGDHKAIAFRRKSYSMKTFDAVFSGTYESVEESSVAFPFDRLGHQYLVIFWSKGTGEYETFLGHVREQQERFPGRFEIYSFNLDKLPDAGLSILLRAGIKCMAMHLPGGKSNSAYNAYGLMEPLAIFVNAQGHVSLNWSRALPWPNPTPARGEVPANPGPGLGKWLDDERYLAQLRSLFIGDFLARSGAESANPELEAIRKCFIEPPFRYRLTQKESLENYSRAEKLCSQALKKNPKKEDDLVIRNHRIIALIGMWNLAREPKYLEEAVKEAKAVLGMNLPSGKDVAARFCLANAALRKADANSEKIVSELVEAEGEDKAPVSAVAAATILAIEANAATLYREYRKKLLRSGDDDDPALWPVLSFIRDRHHNYRLFWANPGRWGYTRQQRYRAKYVISGVGEPVETNRVLEAKLKALDEGELDIPEDTAGKMTGVVFIEPPEDESERSTCLGRLETFTSQFSKEDVPVIVVFLSENMDTVKSLAKECNGSFRVTMLPGGLKNPLVRRLGILSADRIPNVFLLRSDGTIAWSVSGLNYPVEHSDVVAIVSVSIGINIEKLRTDQAFEPLKRGDFKKALSLLTKRLPPQRGEDAWTHDRLHGRALAYMGLHNWEAALAEIDAAIAQRRRVSRYGRTINQGIVETHIVRAMVLKKLGRTREEAAERAIVEQDLDWLDHAVESKYPPSYARQGIPVGVYDDLLKRVRTELERKESDK